MRKVPLACVFCMGRSAPYAHHQCALLGVGLLGRVSLDHAVKLPGLARNKGLQPRVLYVPRLPPDPVAPTSRAPWDWCSKLEVYLSKA